MAELNNEDLRRNTDIPNLYPRLNEESNNLEEDKYVPTVTQPDIIDSETPGDKWNFPTTTTEEDGRHEADRDTLDGDNTLVDVNRLETSNKERRKNNRLQSGAKPDKYSNAHRFPGGHGKANVNRQKPSAGDQNITPNQTDQKGSRDRSSENGGPSNNRRNEGSPRRPDFVHRETDDFVFFWREGSPFSQWHRAKFTLDGKEFNCAEQYMMYQKAKMANNDMLMDLIMNDSDPKAQKGYGRQIPDFDYALWETMREDVVKQGNIAKNPSLQEALFNTYPRTLVEASPHDQVWGIGLTAYDSDALNMETWKGENLLGKILTEVRNDLLKKVGFLE